MEDLEIRRYEMFKHVGELGSTHADAFPPNTLGGELFATIASAVAELEKHAAAQSSGRSTLRQSTATKAVARASLQELLEMYRRTARGMALVTPGLDNKFRIPRKMTDAELLNTARAFAADAPPLKAEFLRREMPATFIEDLHAQIEAFELADNSQNEGSDTSVAARAEIDAAIERGMNAIRQLDPIVRNKLRNDPAGLAAWESARHVERPSRSSKSAAASAADTSTKPEEPQK
jgi:hypothetical protein